jgi:hypothetical protein
MNVVNALNPLRLLCLIGYHRYTLLRRSFLTGRLWMRYDRCDRCGYVSANPEQR